MKKFSCTMSIANWCAIEKAINIVAGFEVTHLVEVGNFYVAFSAEKAVVLKEGYDKASYFERVDNSFDEDEEDIIKKGTDKLFSNLSDSLGEKCKAYAKSVNFKNDDTDTIKQCFDDVTHDFMRSEFGTNDYDDAEIAGKFYQFHACDIRNDAINSVICKIV